MIALEDYRVLYNSPQIEEISGFTPHELNANSRLWEDQIFPEDNQRVVTEMLRCQTGGVPFECEYRIVTRDGRVRWVMDTASMVLNSTGQPLFMQGVIFDITSRKQYEEQLQQNIARASALAEISSALVESTLDHQEALGLVARRSVELVGNSCVIRLLSEDGQWLDVVTHDHRNPKSKEILAKIILEIPQRVNEGILGQVVASGEPQLMAVIDPQQIQIDFKPEFLPLLEQLGIEILDGCAIKGARPTAGCDVAHT